MNGGDTEIWHDILSEAIYTPSPHNVQPWRVRVTSARAAELLVDPARTLPKEDPSGRFVALTMGMFAEAVSLAAAHRGFALAVARHDPPPVGDGDLLPFAALTLAPERGCRHDYDPALLRVRRTSRRADYLEAPVPPAAQAALRSIAADGGSVYTHLSDPALVRRVLDRNTAALIEDLNTTDYHDELVGWFRFSDEEALRTRDGLSYRCMNTAKPLFWWAARFPHTLQCALLRPFVSWIYRRQIGVTPAIGMLSGAFENEGEAFDRGGTMMRFWLELARRDLSMHPFGNLVTNDVAARFVRDETGIADVYLIFRLGYSPRPPASLRRTIEEILVS